MRSCGVWLTALLIQCLLIWEGWPQKANVSSEDTLLKQGNVSSSLSSSFACGSNAMHALLRLHLKSRPLLPRPNSGLASLPPHLIAPAAPRCTAGVKPAILDDKGNELEGEAEGILAIKQPWPSTLRTVYGDHKRYQVGLLSRKDIMTLVVGIDRAALALDVEDSIKSLSPFNNALD